jgi:hypothetical protein
MAEFNPEMRFGNIPDWTNAPGRLIDQSGLGELFGKVTANVAGIAGGVMDKKASSDIDESMRGLWETATTAEAAEKAGIPVELAKGMSKIALFQKAIEKGGVSQTNALAQMEAEVKRLTNKYPQRADEIQQAYAKATGNTAANDLYRETAAVLKAQSDADSAAQEDSQKQFDSVRDYLNKEEQEQYFTRDRAGQRALYLTGASRESDAKFIQIGKAKLEFSKAMREGEVDKAAPLFAQEFDNNLTMMYSGNMNKVIEGYKSAMADGNMSAEEKISLQTSVAEAVRMNDSMLENLLLTPFDTASGKQTWNQIFANNPGMVNTYRERVKLFNSQLQGLLTNDSKTGILELEASRQAAMATERQSRYLQTQSGQAFQKIQDAIAIGGKPVEEYIKTNLPDILKEAGVDDLAKVIAGDLTLSSFVPGATLGGEVGKVQNGSGPSDKTAVNSAARAHVESSLAAYKDTTLDNEVWLKNFYYLYNDDGGTFYAKLSPRENQFGVSQQELVYQYFTGPGMEQIAKDRGVLKEYSEIVRRWAEPNWGSLPEDIRGRAGVFVGSGNTGNAVAKHSFNTDTMEVEFRLDTSKIKDMGVVQKFVNAPEGDQNRIPLRDLDRSGLSIQQLQDLRASRIAIQRLNLVMGPQVRALKALGFSDDRILSEMQQRLQELSPGKQDPFIQQIIPLIGQYAKDVVTGKVAMDNTKTLAEGLDKAAYGDNLGINPEGTGTQLNVLEDSMSSLGDDDAAAILGFVSKAEGADFNTLFGGSKVILEEKTVAEVQQLQRAHGKKTGSSATGAYQVMRKTLSDLIDQGVVDPDEPFTEDVQNRIGMALLKRRGYDEWKSGKLTTEEFADRLALEWAALPNSQGKSAHEGKMGNKARVPRAELVEMLEGLKT